MTSHTIPDDLLRDIDAALREAHARLDVLGEALGDLRLCVRIAAALDRLEYRSEAAKVQDLIAQKETKA